jgi:hypothetical protein
MRIILTALLVAGMCVSAWFTCTFCTAGALKPSGRHVNPPSPHLKAFGRNECVELQWTDSDVPVDCFYIDRSQSKGGDFERVDTIPVDPQSRPNIWKYEDDGVGPGGTSTLDGIINRGELTNGHTYYFRITACDDSGVSTSSKVVPEAPNLTPPGLPGSIVAVGGDKFVNLGWDLCEDATSYDIFRSKNGGIFKLLKNVYCEPFGFTDTDVTNGSVYCYYVRGVNRCGKSLPTPKVAATPTLPHLNARHAIQIARRFCSTVGQPMSALPRASIHYSSFDSPISPYESTQTYWVVDFRDQADLEISDATGQVISYQNADYERISELETDARPGRAEPKEKAAALFARVLKASGVNQSELSAPDIQEKQESSPPTKGGHTWEADVSRVFHGIKYDRQGCSAIMEAEPGTLECFYVQFLGPPAIVYNVALPKRHAVRIARATVATAMHVNVAAVHCKSASLAVVRPNWLYQKYDSLDPKSAPPVVVWACRFMPPHGDPYYVWVDARDGSIAGGRY